LSSPAFTAIAFPAVRSRPQSEADDQARARGYAAGYAQGAREAERELTERRAQLDAEFAAAADRAEAVLRSRLAAVDVMLRALDARIEPVVESAQQSLAVAALELAEAVVGVELRDAETAAKAIVSRVLASVDAHETTTVRVHRADLPLLTALFAGNDVIGLVADDSLRPGDAIAELPSGFVDARIQTALDRARTALLGEHA
jgi:flagellar assembly protein FliH